MTRRLGAVPVLLLLVWLFLCTDGTIIQWSSLATSGQLQWSDASNWINNIIPGAGDAVQIVVAGSYTVRIDKDVVIHSLIIGSGTSNIELIINHGITFNVTESMITVCPFLTVYGNLVVNSLQWSGQYLDGSSNIGLSSTNGQLIVSSLLVKRDLYQKKYLRDIIIVNKKNITIDTSMHSCYLYCEYCRVINEKNSTFLSNEVKMYLSNRPSQSDSDGFGAGIINQGHLIITSANSLSSHWYWDIRNSGTVKVLTGYYGRLSNIYFYNRIINNGLFQMYMTYIFFDSNNLRLHSSNGLWEIYSFPFRHHNAPRPVGDQMQWQWNEYLADVYQNMSADLWNPNYVSSVHVRYVTHGQALHFNKLTMFGRVLLQTSSIQGTTIYFSQGLNLGQQGEMKLLQQNSLRSNDDNNRLVVGNSGSGDFSVNLAVISHGWTVEISSGSRVTTYRRLVVQEGAQFIIHPGSGSVDFRRFVGIKNTGILTVSGRSNTTINGILLVQGMLNITNSSVEVTSTGELQFTQGSLVGQLSHLYIHKLANISGDFGKSINGITVHVEKSRKMRSCVIAEYFQYRVDTDLTSRINSVIYFPGTGSSSASLPSEFDDPATEPNTAQFLESLDRKNEQFGSSPIAVTSSLDWFDIGSPSSYTYSYAFRMWTLLQIDDKGLYTFFIDSGYGMQVRLWLNDEIVFTGNQYSHLISGKENAGSFTLNTGLNRLRLDVIQKSSEWQRENAVIVTYSGPTFAERSLNADKMFLSRVFANGTLQYANPKFYVTKFLPSESTMIVGGKGYLFANNGPSVTIGKTGVLEVVDDIIWLSHSSFSFKFNIINSGKVIKTGDDGIATFYAYYTSKGGSLISYHGQLEFKNVINEARLVHWNNPAGGRWFDANNWNPAKVPESTDFVHIAVEGTFFVIIPGHSNVTIQSLTVGSASSFPELVISSYSKLTVIDRLNLFARVTTISGVILAQYVSWTGERIRGSTFSGEIIAKGAFTIHKGRYTSKYLSQINITAWNGLTIDASLNSQSNYLYCDNCFVINMGTSTMLANMMRWSVQGYDLTQSDGFRVGLINYGLLVYERYYCCSSFVYWDIRNYGEIKIVNMQYRSSHTLYLYGTLINYNLIEVYVTNLYFYRSLTQTTNGTWIMYGQPVRYQHAPLPVGQNQPGNWKKFLSDLYQNTSDPTTALWDPSYRIRLSISYSSYSASSPGIYSFNKFITYGRVEFTTQNCHYVVLRFNQGLYMNEQGKLNVDSSSDSVWNAIEVGDDAGMTVGEAHIQTGWKVTIGQRSNVTFCSHVIIYKGGSLIPYNGSVLTFHDHLTMLSSSLLHFSSSTVTCLSSFFSAGNVEIGTGRLNIYGSWNMFDGHVTGSGGTIYPYGGWNITGDYDKTLKGINIMLDLHSSHSQARNGIIADYFQYRVDTDRTSKLSRLSYFPDSSSSSEMLPSYFDNSSAIPNVERIEATLQHFPKHYGTGPLYTPIGDYLDTNDPRSFTYRYAARLWAFLKIDVAGNYTFYFVPGYSLRLRLWIDDQLKETVIRRSLPFPSVVLSGPYSLAFGFRKIRIDYMVGSSYWSSIGSCLLVYYSGPGLKKQLIPENKLFYRDGSKYVKTSYSPANKNIASFSGNGLILAQNAVNVTICSKCEFHVLEDVLWYSDKDFGGATSFINSGLLVRLGMPGTAVIYGKYAAKVGSNQKTIAGVLEFRDAETAGGLAIWNNPKGGSWTDYKNWNPKRVPRPGDVVYVNQAGIYQVTVPDHTIVNVTSIFIGSSRSLVELVIKPYSKVYVQDRIGVHAPQLTLQGLLKTSKMTWTGRYLVGSNKFPGKLIVDSSIVIIAKGSYNAKYLHFISVQSNGIFTVDSTFGSTSNSMECMDCLIYNYGTMLLSSSRWDQIVSSIEQQPESFQYGIANYGAVVVELQTTPYNSNYLKFGLDILNYGNWSVICKRMSSSCYVEQRGLIVNYGRLLFYMTSITIENSGLSIQFAQTNGTWEIFGKPYRANNVNQPPGYQKQGDWQEYIDNVYENISMGIWDVKYQFRLYLRYLHNVKLYFNDLRAYGRISMECYQCRQTQLLFDTRLDLGSISNLNLLQYSSSTDDNHVLCGDNTMIAWHQITIEKGWSVDIAAGSILTSLGRVLINGGASFNAFNASLIYLKDSFVSMLGSKVWLIRTQLVVTDWTHKGTAVFDASTVEVRGKLEWEQGLLSSRGNSLLKIQQSCIISSNFLKALSGLHISIESPNQGGTLGVVAEYFQYRVSTSRTTRLTSIFYFPGESSSTLTTLPSKFDAPSTKANFIRIESTLQRVSQYYGNAPLAYQADSTSYDLDSANSFTYTYAARLWTYLMIDKSGEYTFYFQTGYGMRVRLWLDDKILFSSQRYTYFSNEEMSSNTSLQTGYSKLRIDYIQESSYWSTRGGIMVVSYEGPGISKQVIPDDKLFAVCVVDERPTAAAVNLKFLTDRNVCRSNLPLNSLLADYSTSVGHMSIEGTGVLITQHGVNITVSKSGILELKTDADWPVASSQHTQLRVEGMVIKSKGNGKINLNTEYELVSTTGCLKSVSGTLELGTKKGTRVTAAPITANISATATPTEAITTAVPNTPLPGILLIWKGGSGDWEDITKWNKRIPDVNDDIQIHTSPLDQITINTFVTINSLDVSGGRLVVLRFSRLTVTNHFIDSSEKLDIHGILLVKSFTWSGHYIRGALENTASNEFGRITVTDKMAILKGSHGSKTLYDIDLYSKRNLTVEESMESSSSLTCANCVVIIAKDSLFFLPGVNLYSGGTSSQRAIQSDGFKWGLINYGNVVMAHQRSTSWRWDVRNYANLTIVCVYYSNMYKVSFYKNHFFNNGTVTSYSSSLYFDNNDKFVSNEGSFSVYGVPGIYMSNYDMIPGYRKPWLYKVYIHYMYDNHTYKPVIWDLEKSVQIRFQSFSSKEVVFSGLQTYGKVNLYLYSWQHSQLMVSGNLYMSPESTLQLGSYGTSPSLTNNTFAVGDNATRVVFGDISITSPGYELQVLSKRVNVTFRRVITSGRIVVDSPCVIVTHELVIGPTGTIVTQNPPFSKDVSTIHLQRLQSMGFAVFKSATVTVLDRFLWKQNYIEGSNTLMYIRGIGEISGDLDKTLDGVGVIVGASSSTVCPKPGVIAEYFQYRIATATTPIMSSIYHYYYPGSTTSHNVLPQQFDNSSEVPTYTAIESGISRLPQNSGNAPLVFSDDSPNNIKASSPMSFTYNYAVRFFTFLKIDQSGKYKFYFITGSGRVRLWINDQVHFTGRSYTNFMQEEETQDIHLTAGFHKLRVDNFITSNSWQTRGSMLYVLYEGPGVLKQTLPEEKQFFCKINNTTGVNEYVTSNPQESSYMSVGGLGLLSSRNKASVTVEKSGHLTFVSNTVWYSYDNFSSTFYNYGLISKTGPLGSVTICGLYKNKGGTLIHSSGHIDFKHPSSKGCRLVFWNNFAGGAWSNRYNWDPPRVPDETDLVYITLSGSPTVVIPGLYYARANTLIVGGANSNPQLKVELNGKLKVIDRMDLHSDTLIVRGTVDVGQLTWSGKTIESGSTSEIELGVINIHENFNIVKGAIDNKYINNMHIISEGNMTVDMSLYQYQGSILGSSSKLTNLGYMLTIPIAFKVNGKQATLENNGTLVVDMRQRSILWYWDVVNNGKFILYCAHSVQGSSYSLRFYGKVTNRATIFSYGTGLNIYGSVSGTQNLGSVVVKGVPSWKSGTQNPYLQNYGNWSEHVDELYREPVLWDIRHQTTVVINIRSPDGYRFDSYRTYGNVYTTVHYISGQSDAVAVVFKKELFASKDSIFFMKSTSYNSQIAFENGALVNLDCLHIQGRWVMNLTGARMAVARYLVLESNSRLLSNESTDALQLMGFVSLQQNSILSVSHGNVNIDGDVSLAGTMEMSDSKGHVRGKFMWTDGILKGSDGHLNLYGGGSVSGDSVKTMDGITMKLEVKKSRKVDYSGVVAEFFQYRIATAVTPHITSIHSYYVEGASSSSGYVPEHFNNLSYSPNVVRLDPTLTHLATRWGNGPIKYLTSGYGIDYSSPESFTYDYAVRYLTFLHVATTGMYRFYFMTGRGRVRLWIDNKKVFEGRSYTSFHEEQPTSYYSLYAGYHKLRVDLFVTSSYWTSYGSMLIVKLEGPDIPMQILSDQNLTYAYQNGSAWLYASEHVPAETLHSLVSFAGGLVMAKSGSVLNITSSGALQILNDVIYYSHSSLGSTAQIINSGIINKTGDAGIATFYVIYDNQGGQLIEAAGAIEFLDADKHGGVALWNNADGGSFLDATNWVPPRVPRATDIVYVTLAGTYKFIITSPTPITVRSLILGASESKPNVLIEHFTTLVVTHRLDIQTDQVEVQGSITATHLSWSGLSILGTSLIRRASVTVLQTIAVFRGDYGVKNLDNIDLVNYGNMTIDETMVSARIDCQDCRLVNKDRAHVIVHHCDLYGSTNGASPDDDGFVYGLINYGVFAQIKAPTRSSVHFRWHLRNYGRTVWLNTYGSTFSVYLQGVIINNGAIESYKVSLYLYSVILPLSNGSWSIYSTPARQYGLETPSWISGGYNVGVQYDRFIHDMYHNATLDVYKSGMLWKCCSVSFSLVNNINHGYFRFHSLSTYGWVYVSFPSNTYNSRVYFDGTITLSENTEFRADGSTSTKNNTITLEKGSTTQLGRLTYLSSGWTFVVQENATLTSVGDVSFTLESIINISKGPDVIFAGQLIVQDSARFNVDSRLVIVQDGLYVASTINLTNSQIVSERMMRWAKGEIRGPSGHVFAQGGLDMYDQYFKTLNGATLSLDAKRWHSSSGVIAEYFQYRVQTDRTPQRNSLSYYYSGCPTCSNSVPQAFDDPTTAANVARIEKNVNRKPRRYGHGPLVYDQSGRTIDYSSARSFTYDYAVRFSAFFRVWYAGMHTFYFLTGRGRVRLWIDGTEIFTGRSYTNLLEEQRTNVYLTEGYHHLRVDNIQRSSSWSFERNLLIVSYSSACTPKQPLSDENLYYKIVINGSEQYASPAFKTLNNSTVCSLNATFKDLQTYDEGISYGTVRGSGLFLPINGSAIFVERTGVLDVQVDYSWPYDPSYGNRTHLRVAGLIGKSDGTANVDLNCVFNDAGGCRKVEKGSLDLGVSGVLRPFVPMRALTRTRTRSVSQPVCVSTAATVEITRPSQSTPTVTVTTVPTTESMTEVSRLMTEATTTSRIVVNRGATSSSTPHVVGKSQQGAISQRPAIAGCASHGTFTEFARATSRLKVGSREQSMSSTVPIDLSGFSTSLLSTATPIRSTWDSPRTTLPVITTQSSLTDQTRPIATVPVARVPFTTLALTSTTIMPSTRVTITSAPSYASSPLSTSANASSMTGEITASPQVDTYTEVTCARTPCGVGITVVGTGSTSQSKFTESTVIAVTESMHPAGVVFTERPTSTESSLPADPNDWSSKDVNDFVLHLHGGEYSQYARVLSHYDGRYLLELTEDQFKVLVPGDAGTAIYKALKARENEAKSQSDDSGDGVGLGVVVGIAVGGILLFIIGVIVTYKLARARKGSLSARFGDQVLSDATPPQQHFSNPVFTQNIDEHPHLYSYSTALPPGTSPRQYANVSSFSVIYETIEEAQSAVKTSHLDDPQYEAVAGSPPATTDDACSTLGIQQTCNTSAAEHQYDRPIEYNLN